MGPHPVDVDLSFCWSLSNLSLFTVMLRLSKNSVSKLALIFTPRVEECGECS